MLRTSRWLQRALLLTLPLAVLAGLMISGGCSRWSGSAPQEIPLAEAPGGGGGPATPGGSGPAGQAGAGATGTPGAPGGPGTPGAGTGEGSGGGLVLAIPPRPEAPEAMPAAVNQWLAAGGSPEQLPELAAGWGAWTATDRLTPADLDADGETEYLFLLRWQPLELPTPLQAPGYLLAVRRSGETWQAAPVPGAGTGAAAGPETTPPAPPVHGLGLVAVTDLTHDGRPEVVARSQQCGAHTCFLVVTVHQVNRSGEWQTLLTTPELPGGEVRVEAGRLELFAGGVGSVGAGPQRNESWVYAWDGSALTETEHRLAPTRYAHFRLTDGNAATTTGDLDRARAQYQELLQDDGRLEYWADPDLEQPFLKALARFRLLVLAARSGHRAETRGLAAAAATQDGPYARWSQAFIQAAGPDGANWQAGCRAAAAAWGLSDQEPPAYWGYSHPPFGPGSLCPELAP